MAVTITQVQEKLKELGYYTGDIDGAAGPLTAAAVVEFQTANKIEPPTGKLDANTLAAIFPQKVEPPKEIKPTLMDWVLNGVQSKANGVVLAMVTIGITWFTTKFGIQVPLDVEKAINTIALTAFGALIAFIRARFDSPHVASKTPAVIQKPAEFK